MFLFVFLCFMLFGLISFQMTSERIRSQGRFGPVFAWLKEAAEHLRDKRREYREHSRES